MSRARLDPLHRGFYGVKSFCGEAVQPVGAGAPLHQPSGVSTIGKLVGRANLPHAGALHEGCYRKVVKRMAL